MMTHFTLLVQLMAYGDYYVPSSAAALVDGLRGLDDETGAVTIELWAMDAEVELSAN